MWFESKLCLKLGTLQKKLIPDSSTPPEFIPGTDPIDLPERREFWDQIMIALKHCRSKKIRLHFRKIIEVKCYTKLTINVYALSKSFI
jgi:hypothetical protein